MTYSREPQREERGIKIFSEEDFYWQVNISRDQIHRFQDELERVPLAEAAVRAGINPGYVSQYQRSDWMYFLPYKPTGDFRILDLGAGFGNITIPLAKKMPNAKIYAADASLDLLKVLARQAQWEQCTNIEAVKIGLVEDCNLPFQEKSFDLILMNGVLEWTGAGTKTGDPHEQQRAVLAHLKTLLKDDGALYVGIEGRFFPGYFMKVKDPHSQLRFTSVVPRRVADWLCRRAGKPEGYRTYTYSWRGYRALFRAAGFDDAGLDTIYPVASYKDPFFLFRYRDTAAYTFAFTRLAREIFPAPRGRAVFTTLYRLGFEKFFAPSYLFLLRKKPAAAEHTLLEEKVGPLLPQGTMRGLQPIKVFGNLADSGSVSFWLIDTTTQRPAFVVKIKRHGAYRDFDKLLSVRRPHAVLPIAHSDDVQVFPFVAGSIPQACPESIARAISLIKKVHEENKAGASGFIHGDFTLANILRVREKGESGSDTWQIIDWDDWALGQPQYFDVCSLIAHYFFMLKHVPVAAARETLLTDEVLGWFQSYDSAITRTELPAMWHAFFAYSRDWYASRRPSKAAFYEKLLALFPEDKMR